MVVLRDVSRLGPGHAVVGSDRSTTEPRERAEHGPLLFGHFGFLDLVDHSVALIDGVLRELRGSVLPAKRFKLAVGGFEITSAVNLLPLLLLPLLFCLNFEFLLDERLL